MSKSSRRKGANYEREVSSFFRDLGWPDAKRHLEYQSEEAEEGRDLDGTQPFAVQTKCWGKTPSISALEEILISEEYPIPLAILKRSKTGEQPLEVAVMRLEDFKMLLSALLENVKSENPPSDSRS